jgi:putative thymidine phosphorylase
MELKIKLIKWSAGIPVAMVNKETASKIGVHAKDRILITTLTKKPKQMVTILDTVRTIVKKGEIAVSAELKKRLDLKKYQRVNIELAESPKSLFLIKGKLKGKKLSYKEISEIIKDVVNNSLSEVEIALFVSAMYEKGMSFEETVSLIKAIANTGESLGLKGKYIVDKHSIGGIPGNRTTPIVVAICVASGLIMPKTSSRAITTSAGTADVIETIAKISFSMRELKKIVKKTGGCLVWGGALGMVPADSKIIKVEKTLKIDPESQLLASIMAKKLAVGSKYILIDIPYGKTAKVTKVQGLKLKKKFEKLGQHFKKKLKVVLTSAKEPMGTGVGPALELIDVINILDPEQKGPRDLEDKSLFLAAELLEMTGKAKKGKGTKLAKDILDSGKAFEKFKQIIEAQGGKVRKLKPAKFKKDIFANKSLKIKSIDNKKINSLARASGCPSDKFAGLQIFISVGQRLKKKQKMMTIYAQSKPRLREALKFYKESNPIKTT